MVKVKKITQTILNTVIQKRPADSFKGTYGKIALIGGSQNFGGAIIMASLAAVYSGAGLVTTITDPTNQTSLHDWLPEAMFVDWNQFEQAAPIIQAANVVVIGPGLGTDNQAFDLLTKTFQLAKPGQIFVIDGSALTLLAANKLALPQDSINVLTPHQMEWQRVSGIQMADQTPQENQAAAQKLNAIVVVKSHRDAGLCQ
jgi:ADP-dependent NAD(P)H-hydrate dehydratase